jgi:hypothetical protein
VLNPAERIVDVGHRSISSVTTTPPGDRSL